MASLQTDGDTKFGGATITSVEQLQTDGDVSFGGATITSAGTVSSSSNGSVNIITGTSTTRKLKIHKALLYMSVVANIALLILLVYIYRVYIKPR